MSMLRKLIELEKDARAFGFDWPDQYAILKQIIDECQEVRSDIEAKCSDKKIQEEIGDLIHAVISLCIFSGYDVEQTIDKVNAKFSKRMTLLKELAKKHGLSTLKGKSVPFMLELWSQAKILEKQNDMD